MFYCKKIGRAGRDGNPSKCVMFYRYSDWEVLLRIMRLNKFTDTQQLICLEQKMRKVSTYTKIQSCRRKFILEYFDDYDNAAALRPRIDCCDNCLRSHKGINYAKLYQGLNNNGMLDISEDALLLFNLIRYFKGYYGFTKLLLALRGSKQKGVPNYYLPYATRQSLKKDAWYKLILENLVMQGYVCYITKVLDKNKTYTVVDLEVKAINWLNNVNRTNILIEPYEELRQFLKPTGSSIKNELNLEAMLPAINIKKEKQTDEDKQLLKALIM